MRLRLNERIIDLEGRTIEDLLKANNLLDNNRLAVAVNNTVIPRKEWHKHELFEDDSIIIIRPAQGG